MGTTWCVAGRASDRDAYEPCQDGFENEAAAVAWLMANYEDACQGMKEFYIDREDNERYPADLYAVVLPSGDLQIQLANGTPVTA